MGQDTSSGHDSAESLMALACRFARIGERKCRNSPDSLHVARQCHSADCKWRKDTSFIKPRDDFRDNVKHHTSITEVETR